MKLNELFRRKNIQNIPNNELRIANKNLEIISHETSTFTSNGSVALSDVVRSAIRPKVKAIGKLTALHTLEGDIQAHSELTMLLQEPNPIDTLQTLLEKLATQLQLNNNAYAVVYKDLEGNPLEIYPVFATSAQMSKSSNNNYFIEFNLAKGGKLTVPYEDVIHLRQEHNSKEYFGEHPSGVIGDLLQSIGVSDEAVEKAIRNSTSLKWMMKFKTTMKPEDMKAETERFKQDYMTMQNNGGVGSTDNKADLEQIKSNVYVPDTSIQKEKIKRVYEYFGVNEDIIQSNFSENQWSSYYEAEIEPVLIQLSNEFTRKLFLKTERLAGHKITFASVGLQFANLESKIKLVELVDRGLMTPNESREILNLPKLADGDVPIRRLDTARVDDERFQDASVKGGDEIED